MPELPDDFAPHPARDASLASMRAIEGHDRDGWLALFATDAVVADPVGPSPFDPAGNGHHGHDGIGAFYDAVIAPNDVAFTIRLSYAAGNEVANVGTISTTLPDGAGVVDTDGVFTYRVDDDGLVLSLRAHWEVDKLRFR